MSKANLSVTLDLIRSNVPARMLIQPIWRPWVLQSRPGQSKPVKMPLMRVDGVWGTKGGHGGGDLDTAATLDEAAAAPRCERLGVTVNTEALGWAVLDIDWKAWTGRTVRTWLPQAIAQAEAALEAARSRRNAMDSLDLSSVTDALITPQDRLDRAAAHLEQLNDLEYELDSDYDPRVWDIPWVAFRLLHHCIRAGAWVELSVSGLGAHAYIPAEKKAYPKNETRPAWDDERWPLLAQMTIGATADELSQLRTGSNRVGLEFYLQGRFIAVTGESLMPGVSVPLKESPASAALFRGLMVSKSSTEFVDAGLGALDTQLITADRVTGNLGRILRASPMRAALWNGVSDRHNTESEADWAVIMLVAENSGSMEQAWAHLWTCPQLQKNPQRREKFYRLGSQQLSKAMALAEAKGAVSTSNRPPMADWTRDQNAAFLGAALALAGSHAASLASMHRLVARIVGRGRSVDGSELHGLHWFSLGSQTDILRDIGGQAADLRRRLTQLHDGGVLHGLDIQTGDIRVAIRAEAQQVQAAPETLSACDEATAAVLVMDAMVDGARTLPELSRNTRMPRRSVWQALRHLSRRGLIHGMYPTMDAGEWRAARAGVLREDRELTLLHQKARRQRFETERARRWNTNAAQPVQTVADLIEVPDEAYGYSVAEIERADTQFVMWH